MKRIICIATVFIMLFIATVPAAAFSPYQNYTYDADKKSNIEPQAYVPYGIIGSRELKSNLKEPQDIFIHKNKLYIADTGNNRIVITDFNCDNITVINEFKNGDKTDTFNKPAGVFLTESDRMYIADTANERVIEFDENLSFVRSVNRPESKMFTKDMNFCPKRISVDTAGRIFIVSENMSNGMIELDHNGDFVGFFGAVKTKPKLGDIVKRFFATKEQKKRMSLIIPTEYSSNDIDSRGFVYGTVGIIDPKNFSDTMFIHKLNPIGDDILNRDGTTAPMGDAEFVIEEKTNQYLPSMLNDICVKQSGLYTVLDRRFGRVFTYDNDGNLLYVFGSLGNSLGQFKIPVAIDEFGDNYAVLDSELAQVVLFKPTEYGSLITDAVEAAYNRDYEASCDYWLQTLKYTSKSELAYSGVGDAMFNQGKYENAMTYYKLGNNRKYYSAAFEQYRVIFLDKYFTVILVVVALFIVMLISLHIFKKKRNRKRG